MSEKEGGTEKESERERDRERDRETQRHRELSHQMQPSSKHTITDIVGRNVRERVRILSRHPPS